MGEYLKNQYEKAREDFQKSPMQYRQITNNTLFDKSYKLYRKETNMEKFKKILTEIVKVGGWIIIALQELLKVM